MSRGRCITDPQEECPLSLCGVLLTGGAGSRHGASASVRRELATTDDTDTDTVSDTATCCPPGRRAGPSQFDAIGHQTLRGAHSMAQPGLGWRPPRTIARVCLRLG